MTGILVGYARCSTAGQDLTAQREALQAMGVEASRVYVDHGLTGTNRDRPGLREALAAVRAGDTLVVTKLDRLARSIRDAHDLVDDLTARGVRLQIGGSVHDPNDPVGRLLLNVLAMVAEFEADLIRARTREGMAVAKARGRLRGRAPKLTAAQAKHLVDVHAAGERTVGEVAELFGISRATVYRTLERARQAAGEDRS
ncbi:recombinase family protein [Cellulomonas sp. Y8]|uniref:recombinase family protein n=1 Tax=Cellulomonas sp. Y8 TaxID=2591145 RepID=UPI003D755E13